MASLHTPSSIHGTSLLYSFPKTGLIGRLYLPCSKRALSFVVRAEQSSGSAASPRFLASFGRRAVLALSVVAPPISLLKQIPSAFAAENKKGFISVMDQKDGYSFQYPFGWQEVVIEGQDKVFKDVIEPLESVSVNLIPTSKKDIREFGSPQQVAETLIKKVLSPTSQKTTIIEASEHDVDGKTYYTFEFTAQAKNYTRHALSAISVGNGMFYTLTTGANERRWEKMKERLHTIVDSFKISNV